ncbi:MAG TPA: hypothetical protein DDW28_03915 [Prevotella sp.]|nr:hypothetical protein [Candidatus Segatella violae]
MFLHLKLDRHDMGNILINNNYGDNYTVQAGATVVAGGARAAMMREQMFASQQDASEAQDLEPIEEGASQSAATAESFHFAFESWEQKPKEERMKQTIEAMKNEKCPLCKNNFFGHGQACQYAYVFELLRSGKLQLPRFYKVNEFLDYLNYLGIDGLPTDETINSRLKLIKGEFPSWEIVNGSENDNVIANNVGKRFLSLYRKGR